MKFAEMDEQVTLQKQMEENVSPIVLINKFTVNPEDVDQFLDAWTGDATWMMQQPGCLAAQLHRGIGGSGVFINFAVWESVEDFRRAFGNPEFQSKLGHYPSETTASPHLFQKVAVPRVCTA